MNFLYKILLIFVLYFYKGLSFIIPSQKTKKNDVIYLAAFYPNNAGYHWRVLKWAKQLKKEGKIVHISYALPEEQARDFNKNPHLYIIRYTHKRFWQIVKARNYKTIIVRREIIPFNQYGNLFLEKMLRKLCYTTILDVDDDLAASKKQPYKVNSLYGKLLAENGNSFRESFRYYDKFIVASTYLKEYILEYRKIATDRICIIPTCVDYDRYAPKTYDKEREMISLGWIGGNHNYRLLKSIIPLLNQLSKSFKFKLIVIGGEPFTANTTFDIVFRKWSLETEVKDLLEIDVGLMPLDATKLSKGKGGFKLIQYMGLGIVGVAENITVNAEICENGVDSFLYQTKEELKQILKQILEKQIPLDSVGEKAREKIEKNFTFTANQQKYIDFINA